VQTLAGGIGYAARAKQLAGTSGMNLLVTGSASDLAQVLLPRLLADQRFELVLGVDQEENGFEHERYVQVLMDLRAPHLGQVLQGMDTVVHLSAAGYAEPEAGERDDALSRMLGETKNLYARAVDAGVQRVVHLSSAMVYDTQAGNGTRGIGEDHARRAPEGCVVARAMQAAEDWLDHFENEHPGLRVLRLRPHWIVGPRSDSLLKRLLAGHTYPRLPAPHPRLQCVHEEDVADALLRAVTSKARGAMNLATRDAMTLREMAHAAHWLTLPLPAALVAGRVERSEAGCFTALRQSLVLDSKRARDQLDWQPRYERTRDAIKNS